MVSRPTSTNASRLNNCGPMVQSYTMLLMYQVFAHYHECLTCYLDRRARLEVARKFIEIQISEVDRQHLINCKIVVGSWSMHSIHLINHLNNIMLQAQDYTCSCMHCVINNHVGKKLHL